MPDYFTNPDYYCIDGEPYFSIYDLEQFLSSMGSIADARSALRDFRAVAKSAGLPGVHINAVTWKQPLLPGETRIANLPELLCDLEFSSTTSYVWIHHAKCNAPLVSYESVWKQYLSHWENATVDYPCEYYPNVTVGWDSSLRLAPSEIWDGKTGDYPCGPAVKDATPAAFGQYLKSVMTRLNTLPQKHKIMNINSWNEWTESSYLEPDDVWGTSYLDTLEKISADFR